MQCVRWMTPLILTGVTVFLFEYVPNTLNYVTLATASSINTLAFLYCYQIPLERLWKQGATYEKVFDDNDTDNNNEQRRMVFRASVGFIMLLTVGSTCDYLMLKYSGSNLSPYETLGILGGILSIAKKAVGITGDCALSFIHRWNGRHTRPPPAVVLEMV